MASRMDRYYNSNSETRRRSRRNESLYDTIYNDDIEYSNVEGIARIEKTNEIDIDRIREMLKAEEEKKRKKTFQPVFRKEEVKPISIDLDEKDNRNYDIRDILTKAKEEKKEEEQDQYRNLKNTQYNILKNIKLKDRTSHEEETDESDELKELIHTITSNSVLNQINDKDLSLDLLEDLKAETNTIEQNSIKKILEEAKERQTEKTNEIENSRELDKSFFTSSLNFSDEDFDELRELGTTYRRNNILIKILIAIVIVAIIAMIVLYFVNLK